MKTIAVPWVARLADDAEKIADFFGRKGRGRFVHQQDARFLRERGGEFDHLLVGDGQAANFGIGRRV